jgi:hypothetical protein
MKPNCNTYSGPAQHCGETSNSPAKVPIMHHAAQTVICHQVKQCNVERAWLIARALANGMDSIRISPEGWIDSDLPFQLLNIASLFSLHV